MLNDNPGADPRLDVVNRLGRAMADKTRSRMLLILLDGPAYPTELADRLGLTRPNVSNHLACLRDCGIVTGTAEGRQTRYQIADPALRTALLELVAVTLAADHSARCLEPDCAPPGCPAGATGGAA
ncbi:ArsR/SmtB family transcription factor [Corynebacterium sphenisci]|uniref:ArsR/SmtB family transcription factor n=1 Tax=Corynebacterium sphenisci TaxID=191493 RepID=UPI0026E00F5B|nr:metalloregulator ArsR/SmtB family transcription factor [Corynebacterium sphenisci]MDO5731523.1 metalloregulator ArsR/SmtB family transcription factor [Corynebacterium sphenisci]